MKNITQEENNQFAINGKKYAATKKADNIGDTIYLRDIFQNMPSITIAFSELQINGVSVDSIDEAITQLNAFVGSFKSGCSVVIPIISDAVEDLETEVLNAIENPDVPQMGIDITLAQTAIPSGSSNMQQSFNVTAQMVGDEMLLKFYDRDNTFVAQIFCPFKTAVLNLSCVVSTNILNSNGTPIQYMPFGFTPSSQTDYRVVYDKKGTQITSQFSLLVWTLEISKITGNDSETSLGTVFFGVDNNPSYYPPFFSDIIINLINTVGQD
ncbi:MAG: hypothetical protein LBN95_06430 [Prevotellaceae bacterium]|jgi:hypothetical protein|nr:hypothetical protein [Prevotellaceae bacterium]